MTSLRPHSKQEGEPGFGSKSHYKLFFSSDLYIPRMLLFSHQKGKKKKPTKKNCCVCFLTRSFVHTQTQSDWGQCISVLSLPLSLTLSHIHAHIARKHTQHITQVLVRLSGKESACQAGNTSDSFNPWVSFLEEEMAAHSRILA